MSIRAMIRRWVMDPWVSDDPNPMPGNLDLIGGTYDIVHAALTRSTTVFGHTSLLTPPQLTRAAREVTRAITQQDVVDAWAADVEADPSLADQYAEEFGEHGDVAELRRGWAS